jgi:hypothetical protein
MLTRVKVIIVTPSYRMPAMVNCMRPVFVDHYAIHSIFREQFSHHVTDALTDEIIANIRRHRSHEPNSNGLWIAAPLAWQTTEVHLHDVRCGYLRPNCIEQIADFSAGFADRSYEAV